jgi:hypothetical protein
MKVELFNVGLIKTVFRREGSKLIVRGGNSVKRMFMFLFLSWYFHGDYMTDVRWEGHGKCM